MPTTASQLRCQIRWLIRRDLEDVLEIDSECFGPRAWGEDEHLAYLRQKNAIGMVAEHEGYIAGFMVYDLHKVRLRLVRFAVAHWAQRKGVGSALVQRLKDKLSQQRRKQIVTTVPEHNVDSQLFLKSQGFLCVATLRDEYEDGDGLEFLYRIGKPDDCDCCEGR